MEKRVILSIIAAAMLLGGCSNEADVPASDNTLFEKIDTNEQTASATEEGSEGEATTPEDLADEASKEDAPAQDTANAGTDEADGTDEASSTELAEDYSAQIKSEIEGAVSDSLSDELASVNEIYNKYDELRMNAPDQAAMNWLSQWGTLVWKEESLSLLSRLQEKDPDNYPSIFTEYQNWEKYVPSMAEKMSYLYVDGSIYSSVYAYNEAMRYKENAYSLASTLADIIGDVTFSFPDNTPCGYYGDYAGDSYLIITEGMEGGSYDVLVHIDDSKELRGYGTIEDGSDSDDILFTSEDGTVKGSISHFSLDATLSVTESDGSVVNAGESYSFTFKY